VKIPTFRLLREPADDLAAALPRFKWAPSYVGTRHQLGGDPTFIQAANFPSCPACGQQMTFYGQLDSINDEISIADAGMVYVFICFEDFSATALIQSN
jgi:hypothetical protein